MKKLNPEKVTDESIRGLATAVCIQAAADYRKSLRGKWGVCLGRVNNRYMYKPKEGGSLFLLHGKNGWHPAADEGIKPPYIYEDFFKSDWFRMLSGIEDGKKVIMFMKSVKGRKVNFSW